MARLSSAVALAIALTASVAQAQFPPNTILSPIPAGLDTRTYLPIDLVIQDLQPVPGGLTVNNAPPPQAYRSLGFGQDFAVRRTTPHIRVHVYGHNTDRVHYSDHDLTPFINDDSLKITIGLPFMQGGKGWQPWKYNDGPFVNVPTFFVPEPASAMMGLMALAVGALRKRAA